MTTTRSILTLGLTLTLAALPALADDTIRAGIDIWETPGGGQTYTDLNLPAGFFCSGSAPFSGRVTMTGVPIVTSPANVLGKTDTVIERLSDTTFDANGVATVNAIVRAINLKSTAPITVSGCPGSLYWDVRTVASPSQAPFLITIRRSSPTAAGGSFDSNVTVAPRLIFTQQGSGIRRIFDEQTVVFTTQGAEWTHNPAAGGVTYPSSLQIDTGADDIPETNVLGTSNYAAGCSQNPQPNCAIPPCRVLIPHAALWAMHGVSASTPKNACDGVRCQVCPIGTVHQPKPNDCCRCVPV